ncbi:MAG TPA: L,D-transpeptidase family protein [Actinomycetota bacterium]|jgi:lipoprotein-anchoring transpeptidase ErfK/SrfK
MSPARKRIALTASAVVAVLTASLLPQVTASAQDAPGVTLKASPKIMRFGKRTLLSGAVSPAAQGETVSIVDENAQVLATATTNEQGRYAVRYQPRANIEVRAQWAAVFSEPVALRVIPLLEAKLGPVKVFRTGRIRGQLLPAHAQGRVHYAVKRRGKLVGRGVVSLKNGRWFSKRVAIKKPGTYRVSVRFDGADHAPVAARTQARTTKLPNLGEGSRGPMVKVLESRLRSLGYHITGVNKRYDYRTYDAVMAFNKVQGRGRVGSVDKSTWYALGSPKKPRPVSKKPNFHIEVDQTKQVLYMVKDGKVKKILHVSTGAGAATRDGVWHVYRKLAGTSGGGLYYPSYFDGLRALHGWSSVPNYNASHGCVRLPMWSAQWVFGKAKLGTEVRIYH